MVFNNIKMTHKVKTSQLQERVFLWPHTSVLQSCIPLSSEYKKTSINLRKDLSVNSQRTNEATSQTVLGEDELYLKGTKHQCEGQTLWEIFQRRRSSTIIIKLNFYLLLVRVWMQQWISDQESKARKKASASKVWTLLLNHQLTVTEPQPLNSLLLCCSLRAIGRSQKATRATNLRQLEQAEVEIKRQVRDSCCRQILKHFCYET